MRYNGEQTKDIFATNALAGIPEDQTALGIAIKYGKKQEWNAAFAEWEKGSGYRQSGRSLQDLVARVCAPKLDGTSHVYSVNDDFLAVENINCVDADGNVFEQYDKLLVDKDVIRRDDWKPVNFFTYRAIAHFEREGSLFLPSFALSCNIIAALYQHKHDPEVKPVLMQYMNHGADHGSHTQNTIIDWGEQKIIHYPHKSDFIEYVGKTKINLAHQRTFLPFIRIKKRRILWDKSLSDAPLKNGLNDPLITRFVRQLTGLQDPSVLVEIGNYFGKTARVQVCSSNDTRAAQFGCNNGDLLLDGINFLNVYGAARGVSLEAMHIAKEDQTQIRK